MCRRPILPPTALVELALEYRVRPFVDHAKNVGASSRAFPISRCSLDILLMIFQELIDEEAASYKLVRSKYEIKPCMAPLLALVCKQWRNIVYDTPRLWTVIVIDVALYGPTISLSTQSAQTQNYIHCAKGAPVDLYLFGYSSPHWDDLHATTSLLSLIPNIQKFYVQFVVNTEMPMKSPLLLTRAWPALRNTRELRYSSSMSHYPIVADLTTHLRGMPSLNTLQLDEASLTIPRWSTGPPILPELRTLILETSYRDRISDDAVHLTSFLTHSPRIEELHITANAWRMMETLSTPTSSPFLSLNHLRTVQLKGTFTLQPFLSQEISAPAITSLAFLKWMRSAPSTNNPALIPWLTQISNTITTLVLSVTDYTEHHNVLALFVQLHTLSLISQGDGTFLAPLYEFVGSNTEGSNGAGMVCVPSLRFLILSICRPLVAEYFRKLVTARCIPVNAQRTTAAGFPTLENFVIITLDAPEHLKEVARTAAWDAAAMQASKGNVFELRWEFWGAEEARPGRKRCKTKMKAPKRGVRSSIRMMANAVKGKGRNAKKSGVA